MVTKFLQSFIAVTQKKAGHDLLTSTRPRDNEREKFRHRLELITIV